MALYLPYPNVAVSASVLHNRDLYFSRYGCSDLASRWPEYRVFYQVCLSVISREMLHRGLSGPLFQSYFWDGASNPDWYYRDKHPLQAQDGFVVPPWIGDTEFHRTERWRLLYERPDFYRERIEE